jgi:hypothetical protein
MCEDGDRTVQPKRFISFVIHITDNIHTRYTNDKAGCTGPPLATRTTLSYLLMATFKVIYFESSWNNIVLSSCSFNATSDHRPTYCTSLRDTAVWERELQYGLRGAVTSRMRWMKFSQWEPRVWGWGDQTIALTGAKTLVDIPFSLSFFHHHQP